MSGTKARLGKAALLGVVLGVVISGSITWYIYDQRPETRPLEKALWVCDYDVKHVYGPGTPEQEGIVKQLQATGFPVMEFTSPVLYRMGAGSAGEGFMMIPFDPEKPDMALGFIRETSHQPKK